MSFERPGLTEMAEDDLVHSISVNQARLMRSEPGTLDYTISKERLEVFVPEALRRGLAMTAQFLIYLEDNNDV